jgi:hypothetical protein
MKRTHAVFVLVPALLVGFCNGAFAQEAQQLQKTLARNPEKSKGDFRANNEDVWAKLWAVCGSGAVTDACANAAVFAASAECEASARWFKRGTRGWQAASILLTLASAAFTGVGASTTIANAKVFSTLGGTTGLGAVSTTMNANAASDQAGLAVVNSTLAGLATFLKGTGTPTPTPPTASAIFQQARIYGAECAAAANGSPANSTSTTTPK